MQRHRSTLTRRRLAKLAGAGAAAALALPSYLRAQARPRAVVIGGGAGGATAARHIAEGSAGGGENTLDVTLISDADTYTTCFFSNLYLGGFRNLDSITHGYHGLVARGIRKVTGRAEMIDRDARTVRMADGAAIGYDRLVLAPGIDFVWDFVPGHSAEQAETAPHAWQGGPQTVLLKERLDNVADGENVIIIPPSGPFRCPPGPYERASMMAHVLKRKGFTRSRVVILDTKPRFAKQALFEEGWAAHYPGMVEWHGSDEIGSIEGVNVASGTVRTATATFRGTLLNIIPAQKAGAIAAAADLADATGWCPIEAETMRSARDPEIFVVGDASIAGEMPKSGYSANSQAQVAAMHVRADLIGTETFPARYANTCWSLIAAEDGVKVGAQYQPADGKIAAANGFISQVGEDAARRKATYEESLAWYDAITADMFGT